MWIEFVFQCSEKDYTECYEKNAVSLERLTSAKVLLRKEELRAHT